MSNEYIAIESACDGCPASFPLSEHLPDLEESVPCHHVGFGIAIQSEITPLMVLRDSLLTDGSG